MAKQKPAYYKMGSKYVALNRAARKMFKKKGIDYILPIKNGNLLDMIRKK
tara:strand:+ start:630 stop:779 length:150 start_codon:yes stop_codon:yes gene_type:complete